MGFLDEVKANLSTSEADAPSVDRDEVTEPRRVEFRLAACERMDALHTYLQGLCQHLTRAGIDVTHSYDISSIGRLTGARQCDYAVEVDDPTNILNLTLSYFCRSNEAITVFVTDKETGDRQQQFCWKNKLEFSARKTPDQRWALTLDPVVPIWCEFEVDLSKLLIRLKITNHEGLGTDTYSYQPTAINQEFMDELAKFIMRKPTMFRALSGDTVPESMRLKLKEQLMQRQSERAQELTTSVEKEKQDKQTNKGGFFKNLFKK